MNLYNDFSTKEIDKALNHVFYEKIDQIDYDVLKSVCDFAKRNLCSDTSQKTD